jgi:hypothetical protein
MNDMTKISSSKHRRLVVLLLVCGSEGGFVWAGGSDGGGR